ncbi:unnamed protein product, partial [Sphacelaria rigidula]
PRERLPPLRPHAPLQTLLRLETLRLPRHLRHLLLPRTAGWTLLLDFWGCPTPPDSAPAGARQVCRVQIRTRIFGVLPCGGLASGLVGRRYHVAELCSHRQLVMQTPSTASTLTVARRTVSSRPTHCNQLNRSSANLRRRRRQRVRVCPGAAERTSRR